MKTRQVLRLTGASAGVAIGPIFRYEPLKVNIPSRQAESFDEEMYRFESACARAKVELTALEHNIRLRADNESSQIFLAHRVLLDDPMLIEGISTRVHEGMIVERAIQETAEEISQQLRDLGDEIFAQRAIDVYDVSQRLLRLMNNVTDTSFDTLDEASIVCAHDLTPSETAKLNPTLVLGLCLVAGGTTSHAAIMARTLGIPAVVGLDPMIFDTLTTGDIITFNGITGETVINPDKPTISYFRGISTDEKLKTAEFTRVAQDLAYTSDGERIEIYANINDVTSAKQALGFGAEGVGLLRTEALFFDLPEPPTEAQQIEAYESIFQEFRGKTIIVRTLDLGGDKPPKFLKFPEEKNPFLGWRGVRISLDEPLLLKVQIKAIIRASIGYNVQIMFPMVESLDTLRRVQHLLLEVRRELTQERIAYPHGIPIGIMIETPSAAVLADKFALECDFFSLGTNDLTQYTLATDRNDPKVSRYYRVLSPAVLRLIRETVKGAEKHGKAVSICGEMASMPTAIPILIGLGLKRLSMAPGAIPQAKWIVKRFTQSEAREIAEYALTLDTAEEIQQFLEDFLRQRKLL